jgi:hypothetical protein
MPIVSCQKVWTHAPGDDARYYGNASELVAQCHEVSLSMMGKLMGSVQFFTRNEVGSAVTRALYSTKSMLP